MSNKFSADDARVAASKTRGFGTAWGMTLTLLHVVQASKVMAALGENASKIIIDMYNTQ